jgi:hypothetical protein
MRIAEFHAQMSAFNTMFQEHFMQPLKHHKIDAALPYHLPMMHTGHKFETVINGVTMDVYYVSKWDGLECDEVLLYNSIKAQIDDANLFPLLGAETQHQIERLVEQDFNRTQGWEDWQ